MAWCFQRDSNCSLNCEMRPHDASGHYYREVTNRRNDLFGRHHDDLTCHDYGAVSNSFTLNFQRQTAVLSLRTLSRDLGIFFLSALVSSFFLIGCSGTQHDSSANDFDDVQLSDKTVSEEDVQAQNQQIDVGNREALIEEAKAKLQLTEDYRDDFIHGEKGADFQKYIVLHDTEGSNDASSVVNGWEASGNLVAAHFIVNTDGSIVQCVPMDKIAHHAGFGDTGHNIDFGVEDESRDDKAGTVPIGGNFADYGMNSYSIGIEMVHVGGSGDYPSAQLEALDNLITYIDAFYGFQSEIIDHKTWRTGNSDTSAEFSTHLQNYKATRKHFA